MAREAIESVFKARDNRVLTWAQIRNVLGASGADGGIFLDGGADVRDPGADGLSNTVDDGAVAVVVKPGPDGLLGTPDDISQPLFGFTREIAICDVTGNNDRRQIVVTIRYNGSGAIGNQRREYRLTTYVSRFS